MKRILLRVAVYLLTFVLVVGGAGLLGYSNTHGDFYGSVYKGTFPEWQDVAVPEHDAKKPTVAVLMSDASTTTEVFDFLIPYDLFAMTKAYNVYAVAPDKKVKSLSGGLEVVPHYTFAELDALLAKSPDIIVVPYMPVVDEELYRPVREYIQKHKDTTLVSICGGATSLADAGLLDGKDATSHWQAIGTLRMGYPNVNWKPDQRYVAAGNLVTSGGQTGGFDAVLYTIKEKLGEPMAKKVAEEAKYPMYQYVQNPTVDPYAIDARFFGIYVFNNAFQWNKVQTGVLLYDGMEEMALSSVFDTYADTGTTQVRTISEANRPIVTKHGLNIVARYQTSDLPALERVFVTGPDGMQLAAKEVKNWNGLQDVPKIEYLHRNSADSFVFEEPLEDLARQEDVSTAEHAVKRFEYRADGVQLEGRAFAYETYGNLLILIVAALLLAYGIDRRFLRKSDVVR
ncbi:DJ-1/PfpI family protein [Tumebacillus sp. BK434]|uniref:DJ-1/PfpI family protein n=1 Tax=Tumebacillus sp. BK434 TaxID=2512169 RepID=UPI001042AF11|nr:DJ-1/PfpI family protein [Tumebacillus sp. BK434]TCP52609.1 DJ-1/PfpI family protein [Tumebacillus sp. BK434]